MKIKHNLKQFLTSLFFGNEIQIPLSKIAHDTYVNFYSL